MILRVNCSILVMYWAGITVAIAEPLAAGQRTAIETKAVDFVDLIVQEKFENLQPLMDKTMQQAMPSKTFARTWQQVQRQAGDFVEVLGSRRADAQGYAIALVTCAFKRGKLDLRVVYDGQGLVSGFFVQPAGPQPKPKSPPYADRGDFTEEAVEVVTGEYRLPGTLTLPETSGKPPIAVLLHGSGPHDRDETIGPNKVFRDLAWGLAAKGVASLRYEKRTKEYAMEIDIETITYEEEAVEDALSAIELVANSDRFDSDRVVLIGHSLGGQLAPLVGRNSAELDGIVIMAGATRPFLEIINDQLRYLFQEDGNLSAWEKAQLRDFDESVEEELTAGKEQPGILGGVRRAYVDALNAYDPLATAKQLDMPMLVVQGKRDYQVLAELDFKAWNEALADRPDVTFRLYEQLDHLFMAGTGPSYPRDYLTPRNVDGRFIADMAGWIHNLP